MFPNAVLSFPYSSPKLPLPLRLLFEFPHLSLSLVSKYFNELNKEKTTHLMFINIISYFLEKDYTVLKSLQKIHLPYTLYEKAVNQTGLALEFVPRTRIDNNLCEISLRNSVESFKFVPNKFKTPDICLQVVKSNGMLVQYVPKKFINENLIMSAIQNNFKALKCIKERYKTFVVCSAAFNISPHSIAYFPTDLVPNFFIDITDAQIYSEIPLPLNPDIFNLSDNWVKLVEANGITLKYVPDEIITLELCMSAVTQNGLALEFVPPLLLNDDIIIQAITQNYKAISFIPQRFLKYEIISLALVLSKDPLKNILKDKKIKPFLSYEDYKDAIKNKSLDLCDVPTKFLNEQFCSEAIKANALNIQFLPREYADIPSYYTTAIEYASNEDTILKYIPTEYKTNDVCISALKQTMSNLPFVPKILIDDDFIKTLIDFDYNGLLFASLDDKQKYYDICVAAVKKFPASIKHVPLRCLTSEVINLALDADGTVLQYLPDNLINTEFCRRACSKSFDAINYVPKEILLNEIKLSLKLLGISSKFINNIK